MDVSFTSYASFVNARAYPMVVVRRMGLVAKSFMTYCFGYCSMATFLVVDLLFAGMAV